MHLATYFQSSNAIPFSLKAEMGVVVLAVIASVFLILRRPGRSADLFFGVTVAPITPASPQGIAIRRDYLLQLSIHAFIAAAAAIASVFIPARTWLWITLILFGSLWVTFGAVLAFLAARKKAIAFAVKPSMVREASLDLDDPDQVRARGLLLLQLVPAALLCASALFAALRYDHIPARFAVHFNAAGNADRYATRTVSHVFLPFAIGMMLWAMLCLIGWVIAHASRRVRADGEAAARQTRYQRAVLMILLIAETTMAIIFAILIAHTVMPGSASLGAHSMMLAILGIVGMLSAVTFISVRATRDDMPQNLAVASNAPIGDGTPDECWRWGMIYVNKQDPSIVVPKRFGVGYTMNFGNAAAWMVMAIMLACIAAVALLPMAMR